MRNISGLLLIIFFISCKKDKLEGDKAIFIGKWKWIKSDKYQDAQTTQFIATLTPQTEGKEYSIEFIEKGKVIFYENGDNEKCKRIVFSSYFSTGSNSYYYSILLNNKESNSISGYIYDSVIDTLEITNYPFDSYYDGTTKHYKNYFIREN